MTFKYFILCLLLFLISLDNIAQSTFAKDELSSNALNLLDKVENINEYPVLPIVGMAKKDQILFDSIFKSFQNNDLIILCSHPNPYIRLNGFYYYLIKNPIKESSNLLLDHFNDRYLVKNIYGIEVELFTVFDIMHDEFFILKDSANINDYKYFETVDSFILKNGNIEIIRTLEQSICFLGGNIKYYNDIRRHAENGIGQALISLAKYNKSKDIKLILKIDKVHPISGFLTLKSDSSFNETTKVKLEAISNFKSSKFNKFLKNTTNKLIKNDSTISIISLAKALAKQQTKESLVELNKLFEYSRTTDNLKKKYECPSRFLAVAVYANLCPIYEDLSLKICDTFNLINNNFINYYKDKNTDRLYDQCKSNFIKKASYLNKRNQDSCEFSERVTTELYKFVLERDPQFYNSIIEQASLNKNSYFLKILKKYL